MRLIGLAVILAVSLLAGLPWRRRPRRPFMQPGDAISLASRRFASVGGVPITMCRAPNCAALLSCRALARRAPRRPSLACSSLSAPRSPGDPMANNTTQRQPSFEQRAVEQLRALARPHQFRVRLDAEGYPVIPGRYGQIEWFDGTDLAVYSDRPRLFARIWAIAGVGRHQTGDTEMRAVFPPEALSRRRKAGFRACRSGKPSSSSSPSALACVTKPCSP